MSNLKVVGYEDVQYTSCPHCDEFEACSSFGFIKNHKDRQDIVTCSKCKEKFIIDYDQY